jgi:hypothetical protein
VNGARAVRVGKDKMRGGEVWIPVFTGMTLKSLEIDIIVKEGVKSGTATFPSQKILIQGGTSP